MGLQHDVISVNAVGVTVTSSGASARVAIPVMAAGESPLNAAKFVRLQATGFLYIKFGNSTVVATTNDMMLSPNEAEVMVASGATHVAYLQETASAKLNITPLEA